MKAHAGVDAKSGLVHTAGVTTGKVHDAKLMANLIPQDDTAFYWDKSVRTSLLGQDHHLFLRLTAI